MVTESKSVLNTCAEDNFFQFTSKSSLFKNPNAIKTSTATLINDMRTLEKIGKNILNSANTEPDTLTIYRKVYSKVTELEILYAHKYINFCAILISNNLLPCPITEAKFISRLISLNNKMKDFNKKIASITCAYIIIGRSSDLFILKSRTSSVDSTSKSPKENYFNEISHKDLSQIIDYAHQLELVGSINSGIEFFESITDKSEDIKKFCLYVNKIRDHIRRAKLFLELIDKKKEFAYHYKTW